jgi:preprotein translocase subunit SecB
MELKIEHPAMISLKNLYVGSFSFKRKEIVSGQEAPVVITRNIYPGDSDNSYKLELICKIGSEDWDMFLSISMIGVFGYTAELADGQKEPVLVENATAIVFPFLRSQISILTSQPNLTPLILPPINVAAMFEGQKA